MDYVLLDDSERNIVFQFGNVTQYIDGTIVGNEFIDKSGNGYNLDIINNDIESGFGFPYKCSALVAQKAANYNKVPDVNNFWFDSGGTPNQIPVVSFFQNVDYSDFIFTKHVSQYVDGEGKERIEAYISEIVVYKSAITDAVKLAAAYSYFGVPTKSGTAKWVSKTGGSDVAAGTEGAPWATIDKATDTVNTGDIVYVKTNQSDTGDAVLNYIYDNNLSNIIRGIGGIVVQTTSASYGVRLRNPAPIEFSGVYVKPTAATSLTVYCNASTGVQVLKNYITNANTVTNTVGSSFLKLNNNVILGTSSGSHIVQANTVAFEVNNNFIKPTGCSTGVEIQTGAGAGSINNNKFKGSYTNYVFLKSNTSAGASFIGNIIAPTALGRVLYCTVDGPVINFNCNEIDVPSVATSNVVDITGSITNTHLFNYNVIRMGSTFNYNAFLFTNSNVYLNHNLIYREKAEVATSLAELRLSPSGATALNFTADGNKILTRLLAGYTIAAGTESTSASNDKISITVKENFIKGANYYNSAAANTTHGIFAGFNKNAAIKYNYVWGDGYAVVIKGTTGITYASGGVVGNIFRDCVNGVLIKGVNGVYITNNTHIYKDVNPGYAIKLQDNLGGDDSSNCVVKNNIIVYTGTGTFTAIHIDSGTGNSVDKNIYYCPNATLQFNLGGVTKTFAQWQSAGYDTNSVVLNTTQFNSLFTDFNNDDFSLTSGSIAVNFGDTIGVNYDYGLDGSTAWGNDAKTPEIVEKQQTGSYDCGAYVL